MLAPAHFSHDSDWERPTKVAKPGWIFAADAPRITDVNAISEDRKHRSGAVFVVVDSNVGAVMGKEDGAAESIPGNEGSIAQAWVNVRGDMRVLRTNLALGRFGPQGMNFCWKRWCCR